MKQVSQLFVSDLGDGDCMIVVDRHWLPESVQANLGSLRWCYDAERQRALIGGPDGPEVALLLPFRHPDSIGAEEAALREAMASRPLMLQLGLGLPAPIDIPLATEGWSHLVLS